MPIWWTNDRIGKDITVVPHSVHPTIYISRFAPTHPPPTNKKAIKKSSFVLYRIVTGRNTEMLL